MLAPIPSIALGEASSQWDEGTRAVSDSSHAGYGTIRTTDRLFASLSAACVAFCWYQRSPLVAGEKVIGGRPHISYPQGKRAFESLAPLNGAVAPVGGISRNEPIAVVKVAVEIGVVS